MELYGPKLSNNVDISSLDMWYIQNFLVKKKKKQQKTAKQIVRQNWEPYCSALNYFCTVISFSVRSVV